MGDSLRSGELAAAAGVNVETLRYYERRGLLAEPPRRPSGYREYPREAVRVVRFIKRAQELGFKLDVIAELLALRDRGGCDAARQLAESKIAQIDEKLRALGAMKRALAALVASCEEQQAGDCPLLEALDRAASISG